jgi:hypothetical protein
VHNEDINILKNFKHIFSKLKSDLIKGNNNKQEKLNIVTNSSSTTQEEKKLFDDSKGTENDSNIKIDQLDTIPVQRKLSNDQPDIILDKSFEKDKCCEDEEINFKRKSINEASPITNLNLIPNNLEKTKDQILVEIAKKNLEGFTNSNYKIIKANKNFYIEFSGKNKSILKVLDKYTKGLFVKSRTLFFIINALLLIVLISLIYSISTKFYLFSLLLPLIIYCKYKFSCYYDKASFLTKDISDEYKSIFKVSSLYKESKQEVFTFISDIKNYPTWIKNIEEIKFDHFDDKKVNVVFSEFSKQNYKIVKEEIILRKVQFENGIIFLNEKTEEINLAVFIESLNNNNNINDYETKISFFIPINFLMNFKSEKVAERFIKSITKSLEFLNFQFKNVVREIQPKIEVPPSEQNFIDKSELRSKKPSLTVAPEIKETDIYEISQTTKESELKLSPINVANRLYYDVANNLIQELEVYKNKGWKEMEKKSDYTIFYFDEVSGFRSCKAEAVLNKNIRHVYNHMLDLSVRGAYDKNFDYGNELENIDENLSILYLKFKGKWPVSARDFTVLQYANYVYF